MNELFDFLKYKITKPIRLIELFGGIGSQAMALRDIGANFEHYRLVEFDKYAVASYNAIHNTNFTTQDITKTSAKDLGIVDTKNYEYIMTYSFCCQDLSQAGKRKGMEKGSGTRSSLLWEVERLLDECSELPQILLMENVPQVLTAAGFNDWCNYLKQKGYINHYKVLNAKNYGVPQNRERCFMLSFFSKDFVDFDYPAPIKLEKSVVDLFEINVDEKFYLNSEKANKLIASLDRQTDRLCSMDETCQLDKRQLEQSQIHLQQYNGELQHTNKKVLEFSSCVYEPHKIVLVNNKIARTLTTAIDDNGMYGTNGVIEWTKKLIDVVLEKSDKDGHFLKTEDAFLSYGGGQAHTLTTSQSSTSNHHCNFVMEKIQIKQATKNGTIECQVPGIVDLSYPNSETRRGRVQDNGTVSPTVTTSGDLAVVETKSRLRKLTPLEAWRIMGFTDEDFYKAEKVNSNAQLYKQAGNSIVKQVLMAIFTKLIKQ